ncbi:MAG: FAD-binding protein [Candidatus Woesebacteria bacterium]|nr:FAD-binding protein [Candidatus Woesebacteria bacterium]
MADKILQKLSGVQKNVLLKDYTTYKIGGPAEYFFIAKTKEDLILTLKSAKDLKLPVFILGGGSNLLISDKGFKGLVIKINISRISLSGNKAFVGAGVDLTKLAYLSADRGLSGLEWATGIPGTVGGAIYGSAQAFGIKIADSVKSVEAINLKTLKLKSFTKKQCQFSLKNSIFKKNNTLRGTRNLVIVSAVLEFQNKDNNL